MERMVASGQSWLETEEVGCLRGGFVFKELMIFLTFFHDSLVFFNSFGACNIGNVPTRK